MEAKRGLPGRGTQCGEGMETVNKHEDIILKPNTMLTTDIHKQLLPTVDACWSLTL